MKNEIRTCTMALLAVSPAVFAQAGSVELREAGLARSTIATVFVDDFQPPSSDEAISVVLGPVGSSAPLVGFEQEDTASFEEQAVSSGGGTVIGRGFASQTSDVVLQDAIVSVGTAAGTDLQIDFDGLATADDFTGLIANSEINLFIAVDVEADYDLTITGAGLSPDAATSSFFLLEGPDGEAVFSSAALDNLSATPGGFGFEGTTSGRLAPGEYLLTAGAFANADAGAFSSALDFTFNVRPDAVDPPSAVPTPAALPAGMLMTAGLLYRRRSRA